MRGDDELTVDECLPGNFVRRLWIGPTSNHVQTDLDYGSNAWPITLIHQILSRCTSLHTLSVIGIGQARWYRLTGVIPPSVSSLCLGPVHGEVDYRHLPCAPNLKEFISMDTFMLDVEIRDLVLSPTVRTIRRVYSSGLRVSLAFDQLECVERATALEKLEIVCYGETKEEAKALLDEVSSEYEYDRARVILVPMNGHVDGRWDPLAVLFHAWVGMREAHT